MEMTEENLQNALDELELLPPITHKAVKENYKKLSKKYHPDITKSSEKFLKINSSYKLLKEYIENYRYFFDTNEVEKQYFELKFKKQFGGF